MRIQIRWMFVLLLRMGWMRRTWMTKRRRRSVDRNTSHAIFLKHLAHVITLTSWLKVSQCAFHSILMSSLMLCVWAFVGRSLFLSLLFLFFFYLFSVRHSILNVVTVEGENHCTHAEWEVLPHGDIQSSHRLWAQAPRRLRQLRDFCNDRTRAMRKSTMRLSEKRSHHHCSFRSGKNQRTGDKIITLMKKVCCQLSPFSHTQVRGDPFSNLVRAKNENQVAKWKTKESGFSLKHKKSKFSLKSEPRSRSTNFQQILREEVSRNWLELSSLSKVKLITLLQESNFDEINYLFTNNHWNKIGIFVKIISNIFMRWKNWTEFKSYESMHLREGDWSKIRTLFMNSRRAFRNYKVKSIVWMTQEFLKMVSEYAVDYPTFPVNWRYFHLIVILEGSSAILGECWAAMIRRQIFGIRIVHRETFL